MLLRGAIHVSFLVFMVYCFKSYSNTLKGFPEESRELIICSDRMEYNCLLLCIFLK